MKYADATVLADARSRIPSVIIAFWHAEKSYLPKYENIYAIKQRKNSFPASALNLYLLAFICHLVWSESYKIIALFDEKCNSGALIGGFLTK